MLLLLRERMRYVGGVLIYSYSTPKSYITHPDLTPNGELEVCVSNFLVIFIVWGAGVLTTLKPECLHPVENQGICAA